MTVTDALAVLVLGVNAFALASLTRSMRKMSKASKALVTAATTLQSTVNALVDNFPSEDTAETIGDINQVSTVVADMQSKLAPLAPAPQVPST